jgi:hypothetical protein
MSRKRKLGKPQLVQGMRMDSERVLLTKPSGQMVGVARSADLKPQGVGPDGTPAVTLDPTRMQPPGFDGTFNGTCIACITPTDTGVMLEGRAEFHIAAMQLWGIPDEQIASLLRMDVKTYELRAHEIPEGSFRAGFRVCERCAAKAGMSGLTPLHEGLRLFADWMLKGHG